MNDQALGSPEAIFVVNNAPYVVDARYNRIVRYDLPDTWPPESADATIFLADVNETVRFHAVASTFAQNDEASVGPLLEMASAEESVRIKNKVAEGLAQKGWVLAEATRNDARKALADAFEWSITPAGIVARR